MFKDQVEIKEEKRYDVTIECYGHKFPDGKPFEVKTSEIPKGCSKCQGRLHRGWNATAKIPIICNCLRKILVYEEVKEQPKQEIKF